MCYAILIRVLEKELQVPDPVHHDERASRRHALVDTVHPSNMIERCREQENAVLIEFECPAHRVQVFIKAA